MRVRVAELLLLRCGLTILISRLHFESEGRQSRSVDHLDFLVLVEELSSETKGIDPLESTLDDLKNCW